MAGTTLVSDAIAYTRRMLAGMHRGEANTLQSTITSSGLTLTFTYDLMGINRGSYVAIEDEIVYVFAIDAPAKTASVQRGMLGTTGAAHTAGVFCDVNPRFAQYAIRQALIDEIRSWPTDLFKTTTITESVSAISTDSASLHRAFDLAGIAADFYYIVEVYQNPRQLEDSWRRVRHYRVQRNADTSSYPSGNCLILGESPDPGLTLPGSLRVTAACPFVVTTFDDSTDLVTTCGLTANMYDILPFGAAWRLVAGREVIRGFTEAQGESRLASDVPPQEVMRTAQGLKAMRDMRIREEALRLRNIFPVRNSGT